MSYDVLGFVHACMLASVVGGGAICLSVPALGEARDQGPRPPTALVANLNDNNTKGALSPSNEGLSTVDQLTTDFVNGYIAGATAALMMYADNADGPKLKAHFYNCLTKASLNNLELANNVREYTKLHPELQAGAVQIPLEHYLRALCGPVQQ